jgi:hypothetical protein
MVLKATAQLRTVDSQEMEKNWHIAPIKGNHAAFNIPFAIKTPQVA